MGSMVDGAGGGRRRADEPAGNAYATVWTAWSDRRKVIEWGFFAAWDAQ